MKKRYILTIRADNRPGLIHLITGILNRKLVEIDSLTGSKTDVSDTMLVSIVIVCDVETNLLMTKKIKNIIEVHDVHSNELADALTQRTAIFRISKQILNPELFNDMRNHFAKILKIDESSILLSTSGSEQQVHSLYNRLEGPCLLGFSQTGLIVDSNLIDNEDNVDSRIRLLAA